VTSWSCREDATWIEVAAPRSALFMKGRRTGTSSRWVRPGSSAPKDVLTTPGCTTFAEYFGRFGCAVRGAFGVHVEELFGLHVGMCSLGRGSTYRDSRVRVSSTRTCAVLTVRPWARFVVT
jgi:hypothetical protein